MKGYLVFGLPEGVDPRAVLRRLSEHFARSLGMRAREVLMSDSGTAGPDCVCSELGWRLSPWTISKSFQIQSIRLLAVDSEFRVEVGLRHALWALPMAMGMLGPVVALSLFHGFVSAWSMFWRSFPIIQVIMLFCSLFLLVPTFLLREKYVSLVKRQIKGVMADSFDCDVLIRRVRKFPL